MTAIYHITHARNLASILDQGCLWCDNERFERGVNFTGIAYEHIKQRRARCNVPVAKRGVLADYVPFYFAPRSPMLYTIHQGNVNTSGSDQTTILHLVAEVEAITQSGLPFAFTNGHAVMAPCKFYDRVGDLENVDWDLMRSRYWSDTEEDPNRTFRRQAEFLVHSRLPVSQITMIGAATEKRAHEVGQIVAQCGSQIPVEVRQNWYY